MREIRQGEVYWIDLAPRAGSAPAERHPCVVVQGDVFNRSLLATTVVCLITSKLGRADAPGNVRLSRGEANLPKESVVNVTQILTVDRTELLDRMGKLAAGRIDAIRRGLELVFERI